MYNFLHYYNKKREHNMSSYNPGSFIKLDNKIFEKLKDATENTKEIVKIFELYYWLLIKRDWKNRVDTTINVLITLLSRNDGNSTRIKKDIINWISILYNAKLIDYDNNKNFKLNDPITIKIINLPESNYTEIMCCNEEILKIKNCGKSNNYNVSSNSLFAIHCFLNIKKDYYNNTIKISYDKIAEEIKLGRNTIIKAIDMLMTEGLLHITHGRYKKADNKKECNIYKIYHYNKRIDNSKLIKAQEQFKKKALITKIDDPNIYDFLFDEKKYTDIKKILKSKVYCPCLLIGKYKDYFMEEYEGTIFELITKQDINNLIDRFFGINDIEGRYFVIDISNLNRQLQNNLLIFIEGKHKYSNTFPIILLSDYDNIITTLKSRMFATYKQSKQLLENNNLKFLNIHQCYSLLNKKLLYKPFNNIEKFKFLFLLKNSPELYYKEHMLNQQYSNKNIDILISKLKSI